MRSVKNTQKKKNRIIKCRETYLQRLEEARKDNKNYFCSICLRYVCENKWDNEHKVCLNCYNGESRVITWWNYCEPDEIRFPR